VLLGEPRPGYDRQLLENVPAGRRAQIAFRPLVAPAALPAAIAEHDVGLALEERAIVNRDLTITNKILQYLNAGLAVVATPTAGQREVLAHDPNAGVLVEPGDTPAFARALDALLASREELSRRQQAARRLAESTYCWEREAPHLLSLVATALQKPTLPRTSVRVS
jgi:glycosyltransferase involved in cell wall biosynthesis